MKKIYEFKMVYCDNLRCRVNTFEVGSEKRDWTMVGKCPGCYDEGRCLECCMLLEECDCDD